MAKPDLTRHFQRALGDAHRRMLAHQQQRARHRVGEVVVRAWRVVDAVSPAARRATLQAAELRHRRGWSSSEQRVALSIGSVST